MTDNTIRLHASNENGSGDRPGRLAYSVTEASAAIGIGKTKLYELIAEGTLPSALIGRCRRIRAADLDALISGRLGQAA